MDFIRKILSFHLKASAADHLFNQKVHIVRVLYIPDTQRQPQNVILTLQLQSIQVMTYQKSPRMIQVPYK